MWSHLAFTNYVQFFLPSDGDSFRTTKASDLSERDFDAFIEVVKELSPDIVIVWGCVINTSVNNQKAGFANKEDVVNLAINKAANLNSSIKYQKSNFAIHNSFQSLIINIFVLWS